MYTKSAFGPGPWVMGSVFASILLCIALTVAPFYPLVRVVSTSFLTGFTLTGCALTGLAARVHPRGGVRLSLLLRASRRPRLRLRGSSGDLAPLFLPEDDRRPRTCPRRHFRAEEDAADAPELAQMARLRFIQSEGDGLLLWTYVTAAMRFSLHS